MFDEIKWLCVFAKYTSLKFVTESQSSYVSKLIMSPFSPFSVECKKPLEMYFRASKRATLSYFSYVNKLILIHLVHLVLNAKNLLRKTFGNVLLGHLGELRFHISALDPGR